MHIDMEGFSAAGYLWDSVRCVWQKPEGSAQKKGLPVVGTVNYAYHPSARVICLAYDDELWWNGNPPPLELWDHVERGGLVHAWNSFFEFNMWQAVLVPRGWPPLKLSQMRDSAPRARAWGMPGSLDAIGKVLQLDTKKDTEGKRLMKIFSMPRNPTKADRRLVYMPHDLPAEAQAYGAYCLTDVKVEAAAHSLLPPLSPLEEAVWLEDQEINQRGIPVDTEAIDAACELLRQAERVLNAEITGLTAGAVESYSQVEKLKIWCNERGAEMPDVTADTVDDTLKREDLDVGVRRALEIRQALSSVSCKKVWAFKLRTYRGRVHDQLRFCGADRTGRWAAHGCQVQNMPRGLPDWTPEKTEEFIVDLIQWRGGYVPLAEKWGDPLKALSSSLRGLIRAAPGNELITADYSAIEAVVLAMVSGEQWRIDVFKGDGKIYEQSASKITGTSVEEYARYKEEHGKHHPDRALGKVAELASGYHGGVGAWLNFGADEFFTPERCASHREKWLSWCEWMDTKGYQKKSLQDYVISQQVKAWRKASPMVVKFWDGVERAALSAIRSPGQRFSYRDISYVVEHGTLYCELPSGRRLAYHHARIIPGRFGGEAIAYHAWNTNPKMGPMGWTELNTYSGKLTENIVQAIARDILAWALLQAKAAGFATVMHVHDEIVTENKKGTKTLAELIGAMLTLPKWASHYPLRAAGWVGDRFQK